MKSFKSKKPLVSIITPNYNGEKFLEKTIKSVLAQTSKNFEYLIYDACSTDSSHKIIKKYRRKIDFVSIKKDKGHYHALYKGIKNCNGKIILWINSDDLLHKDAVSNVIKIFSSDNKLEWISGINGYIKGKKFSGIPYIYPNFIISSGLAHHNYWGFIQQESISFKKKLFLRSGGFNSRYSNAGDYYLWKNFSKFAPLKTFCIKIGYFRTWKGQNSNVEGKKYFKDTGYDKNIVSFRFIRLIISIFFLPYLYFRTAYKLKKNT